MLLTGIGLRHLAMDTPLEQLSDGYKRRVALAAQLARAPSLLLLDEPLAGVDWPTRASLASLLGESHGHCLLPGCQRSPGTPSQALGQGPPKM